MTFLENINLNQPLNLDLLARKAVEGFIIGLHKSPFHGFSVEFAEHKLYYPGDNIRNIDWKVFARSDKLFTKKYEEETNLRARIVIDISSSMYYPRASGDKQVLNKLQWSCLAAASLVHLLKKQRDAYGLTLFDDQIRFHSQVRSNSAHQKLIYNELDRYISQPNELKSTSTASTLDEIAETIHKRSMVIIFSDMLDDPENSKPVFDALQHLKHNKHEVILFHVLDKSTELEFDFESRPLEFIDLETGEKIRLMSHEVKDTYVSKMAAYENELKLKSLQNRIDFVPVDIKKDFDQVLQSFLIRRTKMKI
ncbi:MAG TPA: DUF58 domain-containing protein [Saprospiraceae bacterium]|nr:DUF58 domain-containing protein [Saprospiraceae bacterium]HQW55022.1 DUF58 domain-containing protein [Saprospiraceae bacterium]